MQTGDRIVVVSDDSLMTGFVGKVLGPAEDRPGVWWVQLDATTTTAGALPMMFRTDELGPEES